MDKCHFHVDSSCGMTFAWPMKLDLYLNCSTSKRLPALTSRCLDTVTQLTHSHVDVKCRQQVQIVNFFFKNFQNSNFDCHNWIQYKKKHSFAYKQA